MKTVIYWFSGTGNSLAVAKALAEQCGDTELVPIFQCLENPSPSAKRIGFVFPVYGWGPPALVGRFIEKLNLPPDPYVFSVITYAGNPGGTLSILRRILQKRGADLSAGWSVKMPENYPPLGGAPAPEKQVAINAEASKKIQKIAAELQQSPCGRYEKPAAVWRMLSRIIYPLFQKNARRADRSFRADEKCNQCFVCIKVCPVKNIAMFEGHPVWMGHCEQCFACFHWCPQNAVQYGRSAKQHRYHHPAATVGEFLARAVRLQ